MSAPKCLRLWIVEAVRDGRVKGTERDSFERHLPTCTDCLDESSRLDELGEMLRHLPVDQPDALAVRRQRQRLMAESDAIRMRQVRSAWPRGLTYAISIAAGVGLIFGLWRWSHHDAIPIAQSTPEPIIDVRPEPGARWSHIRTDDTNGVQLDEGMISLRIQRRAAVGRIVIVVPDGEIEDFGTVLRVRVAETRTVGVTVEEGNVAIRIRGLPEVRLGPGGSWAPEPVTAIDVPPAPNPVVARRSVPTANSSSPRTRAGADRDASAAAEAARSSEANDAEDLAYLEVVKLARDGKATEARSQARKYLLSFPNGFRRVEMLDIATGHPDSR